MNPLILAELCFFSSKTLLLETFFTFHQFQREAGSFNEKINATSNFAQASLKLCMV